MKRASAIPKPNQWSRGARLAVIDERLFEWLDGHWNHMFVDCEEIRDITGCDCGFRHIIPRAENVDEADPDDLVWIEDEDDEDEIRVIVRWEDALEWRMQRMLSARP
jgi:hypothetical protein